MEGDPVVDKLMRPVMDALIRHAIRGASRTDIYNRAYEAVMNSMVVMDTMREQLSKANERAEKAEHELAELKKQTRWIPVSEKLPEEYKSVLLLVESNGKIVIGSREKERFLIDVPPDDWCFGRGFTHWQPLPQPPQERE